MVDILSRAFDATGFPPRWRCGQWSSELGWLHIVSDLGIWGAYLAIPCVLGYFALGRKNLPFRGVFVLFGAFILACGLTHFMDALMFWWPAYRLTGLLKFLTASISWGTVFALVWVTPRALRMRSPEELEREILERGRAEKEASRYAERLRSTNQQLIESERDKSNLLTNVTHELRTPLTLILSPIEAMLEGDRGSMPEADLEKLRVVHNNAVRLLQMVTGVLDISKLDAGKLEVNREPTEIASLTRSIARDFQPALEGRGLELQLHLDPDPSWVMLDHYLYERIVFNLMSNAVKFTPSGGRIEVAVSLSGDRARLSVKDTGIGVAEGDKSRLFERYRQLDCSSTRRFEGTGLGLALVREFAELLGGTAWVESELGGGSEFTVELFAPRREVGNGVAAGPRQPMMTQRYVPPRPVEATADLERLRILVAEDNPELANHITSLLGRDYAVSVAADGEKALDLARDWAPNLILSDIMMPRLDGFELCRAIKNDPSTSRIPVVLLTALTDREALMHGWESGADEYLFKPFHPRELLTRVRTLLAAAEEQHRVESVLAGMNAELDRRVRERTAELSKAQDELEARVQERESALRSLRESENQLQGLADAMPQLAWMADAGGSVSWFNNRWYEYTGQSAEETLDLGWRSLIDPEDLARLTMRAREMTESKASWEETIRIRRRDGQMRWHLSIFVPMHEDGKRGTRWFATHTDVTERMRLEDELRLADRRKDEFVATLAHELRNPLAAIRNCLLVIKEAKNELAMTEEFLEMASRQTHNMSRLLDDLMDVSRIRQGKITLRQRVVDLIPLVEQSIASRRPSLESRQMEVEISLPARPVPVFADPLRIEQIVGNLIDNAAKYSEDCRKIGVVVELSGQEVILRVHDEGVGIPPEMLEYVFDAFMQEGKASDRATAGVGIGLTLVRKLVNLHGGSVEALSEGRGHGSEFVVRLPLADEDDGRPPAKPAATKSRRLSAHARHKVLVVDDNLDSAKSLSMLMTMAGQDVRSAHDGPAAVAQAAEFRPDLVLLDIGLPGMDGYEVCQAMRNRDGLGKSTIVALSGWGQEDDRRRSLAAGFSRHLVKPVRTETIHELLATLDESP